MNSLQLKLCDIQGRLFELSAKKKVPSASFIKLFMNSDIAKQLDSRYNRMQWMGEEYLLEELLSSQKAMHSKTRDVFQKDILYWIGYMYRYWHFYTGEESSSIIRQAPVDTMRRNYMIFHTMDPVIAVEDLKEIHQQKVSDRKHKKGSVDNKDDTH